MRQPVAASVSTPRYFVPHAASPAEPVPCDAAEVVHVMDAFRLEPAYLGEAEWFVCTDVVGQLQLIPGSDRARLPASVQAQLAHHEVAAGRPPRRLAATELFFFSTELVEHPADAEGFNDPVYLYGTLTGPWPGDAVTRVPGQLTVSRGDVLAGFVHGAQDAFRYVKDAERRETPSAWHALLPGDRAEQLAQGKGLVLAYPAVPAELQTHNVANGPQVASVLHAVLAQLQEDAKANKGPQAIAALDLPVASRAQAVAELEVKGFEVKGDIAIPRPTKGGLVGRLAGWFQAEEVRVPREAPLFEFLELSRSVLGLLPGWPTETERALRAHVHAGTLSPGAATPRLPPRAPFQPASIPPRLPTPPTRSSDWMNDFLDAHARKGAATPRLTPMRPAPAPRPAPAKPPSSPAAWQADFAASPPARPANKQPPKQPKSPAPPGKKPDWMNDFED
ncbi:hypothetical protein OV207_27445 [Corallococcus sp. BB11-1]|uniref:hypothetical protein n=1 Tax=Corallococcus sp. BB11-1 TaxID=2996783 RepID=UPI002271C1B2|nr:hypothetical protein [Corallococcus sp. BB11-1]MCY1035213.1 hypothetical protein [Corallococcus sp. BB11-1]